MVRQLFDIHFGVINEYGSATHRVFPIRNVQNIRWIHIILFSHVYQIVYVSINHFFNFFDSLFVFKCDFGKYFYINLRYNELTLGLFQLFDWSFIKAAEWRDAHINEDVITWYCIWFVKVTISESIWLVI